MSKKQASCIKCTRRGATGAFLLEHAHGQPIGNTRDVLTAIGGGLAGVRRMGLDLPEIGDKAAEAIRSLATQMDRIAQQRGEDGEKKPSQIVFETLELFWGEATAREVMSVRRDGEPDTSKLDMDPSDAEVQEPAVMMSVEARRQIDDYETQLQTLLDEGKISQREFAEQNHKLQAGDFDPLFIKFRMELPRDAFGNAKLSDDEASEAANWALGKGKREPNPKT